MSRLGESDSEGHETPRQKSKAGYVAKFAVAFVLASAYFVFLTRLGGC